MQDRTFLRQQMRSRRQMLSSGVQQAASQAIANLVIQTDIFQKSQHIAGYMANQGEIDPFPIFKAAWTLGKTCYLPVIQPEKKIVFVRYEANDALKVNQFNILEPELQSSKLINLQELNLVLMPLVAFDLKGNRLGMGSGFYDINFAFLQKYVRPSKPFLLGLAYDWQQVEKIGAASWDISLDAVATDRNIHFVQ